MTFLPTQNFLSTWQRCTDAICAGLCSTTQVPCPSPVTVISPEFIAICTEVCQASRNTCYYKLVQHIVCIEFRYSSQNTRAQNPHFSQHFNRTSVQRAVKELVCWARWCHFSPHPLSTLRILYTSRQGRVKRGQTLLYNSFKCTQKILPDWQTWTLHDHINAMNFSGNRDTHMKTLSDWSPTIPVCLVILLSYTDRHVHIHTEVVG